MQWCNTRAIWSETEHYILNLYVKLQFQKVPVIIRVNNVEYEYKLNQLDK